MKKLYFTMVVLIISALVLTACGGGQTPTPAATEPPATEAPATEMPATEAPTMAPTEAPTEAPASEVKIGVVTDVGQLEDKSFNQASYEGAQAAAEGLGAEFDVIA